MNNEHTWVGDIYCYEIFNVVIAHTRTLEALIKDNEYAIETRRMKLNLSAFQYKILGYLALSYYSKSQCYCADWQGLEKTNKVIITKDSSVEGNH